MRSTLNFAQSTNTDVSRNGRNERNDFLSQWAQGAQWFSLAMGARSAMIFSRNGRKERNGFTNLESIENFV
jgi:hypothetical protein